MPSVRSTRWPWWSCVCHPSSRAATTRSAIMSIAVSSGSSSHSVPPGRRYLTCVRRFGCWTSWREAEPLGQRVPWLIGELGWPSMSTRRPPSVYTTWPHPTAQYGHTDSVALSPAIREPASFVFFEAAQGPVPQSIAFPRTGTRRRRWTSFRGRFATTAAVCPGSPLLGSPNALRADSGAPGRPRAAPAAGVRRRAQVLRRDLPARRLRRARRGGGDGPGQPLALAPRRRAGHALPGRGGGGEARALRARDHCRRPRRRPAWLADVGRVGGLRALGGERARALRARRLRPRVLRDLRGGRRPLQAVGLLRARARDGHQVRRPRRGDRLAPAGRGARAVGAR